MIIVVVIEGAENVSKLYPVNVFIAKGEGGLEKDSVALCNQIRTVDEVRIGKVYGNVSPETMARIDMALKISLALQ